MGQTSNKKNENSRPKKSGAVVVQGIECNFAKKKKRKITHRAFPAPAKKAACRYHYVVIRIKLLHLKGRVFAMHFVHFAVAVAECGRSRFGPTARMGMEIPGKTRNLIRHCTQRSQEVRLDGTGATQRVTLPLVRDVFCEVVF